MSDSRQAPDTGQADSLRLVVMGVSGCGKTSLGLRLAGVLGADFTDADDLHPPANIARMRAGLALDDAARAPWLALCAARLGQSGRIVMACSALRRSYRDILRAGVADLRFLHLAAPMPQIAARLAGRRGHFMPSALLASQYTTLEPPGPPGGPDAAVTLDALLSPDALLQAALRALAPG